MRQLDEKLFCLAWARFDVSEGEILGDTKMHHVVPVRHAIMAAMRHIGLTYEAIGARLKRNHRTVMVAINRSEIKASFSPEYATMVAAFCDIARRHRDNARGIS